MRLIDTQKKGQGESLLPAVYIDYQESGIVIPSFKLFNSSSYRFI
jgi:hypothetical protein